MGKWENHRIDAETGQVRQQMTLTKGQIMGGRYRVVFLIGQGGMGAVYRAWDTRLNIPVALKEMIPQANLDTHLLAQLRQQFQQEATVLAQLNHPHLVDVTDFFEEGDNAYLVMRLIEGESLADRIVQEGPLPEAQVLAWAKQLLDALGYCHSRGIIHRDVKPQNVVITPEGQAVLVDFGLVKLWDPRDPHTRTVMRGAGTPEYAPPEQYSAQPEHTDQRSDLYSLGAMLYYALTSCAPLTTTDRMADPDQFVPVRGLNPRVGFQTEAAVLRAMELPRSKRFQSAQEMAAALCQPSRPPQPTQPHLRPHPAGSAVLPPRGDDERLSLRHTASSLVVATPENLAWLLSQPKPPMRAWWEKADMELCLVPAGRFLMGSPDGEGYNDEHPQHTIYLDAYYIGRYPVTQAQYTRFAQETGYRVPFEKADLLKPYNWDRKLKIPPNGMEEHPVVMVFWDDAVAYCKWAGLRLPTEAEWEKAASWDPITKSKRVYPWGDEWDPNRCNWRGEGNKWDTTQVGTYSPAGDSPYGCADMAGNVWEWVADWYDSDYYSLSPSRNPPGSFSGEYKVIRGGSWDYDSHLVRSTNRNNRRPDDMLIGRGFRCAAGSE